MKYAIVSVKDLNKPCWSPLRFTNSCEDCDRAKYPLDHSGSCKLPEGMRGRVKILDNKIKMLEENLRKLVGERANLLSVDT